MLLVRCGFVVLLLAPLALLLAGLTVVVIDARFGAVGFAGLADAAVVEHVLLVHLLDHIVLGDLATDLLDILLAGRQGRLGEVVL